MAVSIRLYPNAQLNFIEGDIDFDANTIKYALLNTSGTFNDAHDMFDDVNANEVAATGGYTAGGDTVASKTQTVVDSSALTAWAGTTAYVIGDVRRAVADNGHCFLCTVAGTSGGAEPTWVTGTFRETADGGTVKWCEFGAAVVRFDSDDPSWGPGATIAGIRYGVLYKDTGTPANSPLIAHVDYGATEGVTSGTFSTVVPATGWAQFAVGSPV